MTARAPEILFVDPSVPDLETILFNLRPEVEAIVKWRRPAARQMAAALKEYRGLNTVHVIAHGAPGLVRFATGEWSAETLEDEARDLAAIGDALGTDRDLLLWSCYAGEGTRGRALVDALHRVTGAPVGAATHLVGAAALGGGWELEHAVSSLLDSTAAFDRGGRSAICRSLHRGRDWCGRSFSRQLHQSGMELDAAWLALTLL